MVNDINNSSSLYWSDFENDTCEYIFTWDDFNLEFLYKNRKLFIQKYIELTLEYGMAVSHKVNIENLDFFINNCYFDKFGFVFNSIYTYPNSIQIVNYCNMFVTKKSCIPISNINHLYTIEEVLIDSNKLFALPLYVYFSKNSLFVEIKNNIFFSRLYNLKTNEIIDNYDLARLNTPRFNSFLTGLKTLCQTFKSSEFNYGNYYDNDLENPVFFNVNGIII